jgi:FkbM family methyltransferase
MSGKTAFLNFFRSFFTIPPIDSWMARLTTGRDVNGVIVRMMPPNYLFPNPTFRKVERSGIKMDLNIHDYMDHAIYFDYRDASWSSLFTTATGSKVILDIGANNGFTALQLSRLAGVRQVIAFEPDSRNFEKAKKNLDLNLNPESIRLLNLGLGSSEAELFLRLGIEGNLGTMRVSSESPVDSNSPKIRVKRLDDVLTEEGVPRVDFIKIDVEGYELEVLKGGIKTLETSKPRLFIEIDDANLREQASSATELIQFLKNKGYECTNTVSGEVIHDGYDFAGKHFDAICVHIGS